MPGVSQKCCTRPGCPRHAGAGRGLWCRRGVVSGSEIRRAAGSGHRCGQSAVRHRLGLTARAGSRAGKRALYHRLLCRSCSSRQCFAFGFLQIPPRDAHPCRSANRSPCRAGRGLPALPEQDTSRWLRPAGRTKQSGVPPNAAPRSTVQTPSLSGITGRPPAGSLPRPGAKCPVT